MFKTETHLGIIKAELPLGIIKAETSLSSSSYPPIPSSAYSRGFTSPPLPQRTSFGILGIIKAETSPSSSPTSCLPHLQGLGHCRIIELSWQRQPFETLGASAAFPEPRSQRYLRDPLVQPQPPPAT